VISVPLLAGLVVFALMLIEAAIAAINERALRAQGAVEPPGDVFGAMQFAYPAAFLVMIVEGDLRHVAADRLVVMGGIVFALAKALKYWAIATLGARWTFRVLVPPGSSRIRRGPYRWIAHPNYLAVGLELIGTLLALHAFVTGPIAVAGFSLLMWRRIAIEENALAEKRT
jgi:methyltransferase